MLVHPARLVIDTNVMLRGISNSASPSGRVLALCDQRQVVPLLQRTVLAEYREILMAPEILARFPNLNTRKIEVELAHLSYIGELIRNVRVRFSFPRDPKDAKFIELAIAGGASNIVTVDPDLLDLRDGHDDASKRFRQRLPLTRIVKPHEFLQQYDLPSISRN